MLIHIVDGDMECFVKDNMDHLKFDEHMTPTETTGKDTILMISRYHTVILGIVTIEM